MEIQTDLKKFCTYLESLPTEGFLSKENTRPSGYLAKLCVDQNAFFDWFIIT